MLRTRNQPPPPPRRRRRRIVAAVVVGLLLMGAGVGVWQGVTFLRLRCGEGPIGVDGLQRTTPGGECVGVTDGREVFLADLRDVESRIATEDGKVRGQDGGYVSVAYLSPMSLTDKDTIPVDSLRHEIEGAYMAQMSINTGLAPKPRVQLLLANEGSQGVQWHLAVQEVERSVGRDHLVAVAGLGPSRDVTMKSISELSKAGIPMMGSILTTDTLPALPFVARVAPTNADEVKALINYTRATYHTALIVRSKDRSDSYSASLADQFQQAANAGGAYRLVGQKTQEFDPDYRGSQFSQIVQNICAAGPAPPEVVLFAGRSKHIPAFLDALNDRSCANAPINVVTGDSASALQLRDPSVKATVVKALRGRVTLTYSSLAHPQQWGAGATQQPGYASFVTQWHNDFPLESMDDGRAMMAYDSMLAVYNAISKVAARGNGEWSMAEIAGEWTLLNGANATHGATGTISIGTDGNPQNKAIPILQIGPDATVRFLQLACPDGQDTCT